VRFAPRFSHEYLKVPDYWPEVLPKGTWEAFAEEVPPEV